MSGEISVISTIDTAHEDMIVSYNLLYSLKGRLVIPACSLFGVSLIRLIESMARICKCCTCSMMLRWIILVKDWPPALQIDR